MATGGTRRVIAIGDLNGAHDVLLDILRGTGLINRRLDWSGKRDELVQMGDLFNRGGGAAQALRVLLRLQRQARKAGGKVTILLGNHEVMTALRHEGYCTEDEYLSFASAAERRAWPARVRRAMLRLIRQRSKGIVTPIEPRLGAWKMEHVPGRTELRRALGPRGTLGRALRALPVAYLTSETLFVHGGLLPAWACAGVDGLNQQARECWAAARTNLWSLPKKSLFRNAAGPLWDRSLARGGPQARRELRQTLELLSARRMVVGHSQTASLPHGREGRILVTAAGRLIAVDVGLSSQRPTLSAALIIEGERGYEWSPDGSRVLWDQRAGRADRR
ncbi:MAG TPA: metallophosphoesterase [Polyangiaceae bacterium]|nr:metallophosphoesterase [Polyangiaceae bacterium]